MSYKNPPPEGANVCHVKNPNFTASKQHLSQTTSAFLICDMENIT